MIGYVEAPKAWGLTRGMARVLGVNLVEAVTEGWLSRGELDDLVASCEACQHSADCTAWLAVTIRAEGLPPYCRNKSEIESLRG